MYLSTTSGDPGHGLGRTENRPLAEIRPEVRALCPGERCKSPGPGASSERVGIFSRCKPAADALAPPRAGSLGLPGVLQERVQQRRIRRVEVHTNRRQSLAPVHLAALSRMVGD